MHTIVNETECERFIIFKVENGGGAPKVGAHIYISALMESYKSPIETFLDNYQKLRADASYILLLSNILASGKIDFSVENMEESLLRKIYRAENIKYSIIYHLHTTPEAIYYCSLATTKENERFSSPRTEVKIQLAINEIIELFKKNI